MAEPTDAPPDTGSGLRTIGWCSWHQDAADDVRIVQVDEQGSGRSPVQYACGPCRKRHGLKTLDEQEQPHGAGPVSTPGLLILMPGMLPTMSPAQCEGTACPWCNTAVTPETGVDLGERHLDRAGVVIHPVACRPCANREARRSFAMHCRMCSRCKRGDYCPDKMPLHRLAKATRS
ncbi:hypothetical protein ACIQFU_23250 [Streptomyces sp. NPDC093065]|uniref:hypothetical protein n=1 Tax=Streptomyces sp. NPDC093065 TaxID=3366021 RepID=UPI0037FA8E37